MKTVKKILCPLDLSGYSGEIAEYASVMARIFDAEVVIVNVVPIIVDEVILRVKGAQKVLDEFSGALSLSAEEKIDKFVMQYFTGVRASGAILEGNEAKRILAFAEEGEFDLIIMGTHGKQGFDHFLFGSVAEKVVRGARIPVITMKPKEAAEAVRAAKKRLGKWAVSLPNVVFR